MNNLSSQDHYQSETNISCFLELKIESVLCLVTINNWPGLWLPEPTLSFCSGREKKHWAGCIYPLTQVRFVPTTVIAWDLILGQLNRVFRTWWHYLYPVYEFWLIQLNLFIFSMYAIFLKVSNQLKSERCCEYVIYVAKRTNMKIMF